MQDRWIEGYLYYKRTYSFYSLSHQAMHAYLKVLLSLKAEFLSGMIFPLQRLSGRVMDLALHLNSAFEMAKSRTKLTESNLLCPLPSPSLI